MSLISLLVIAVSMLAVMCGMLALVGASKGDKKRMAWFLATMIGGAIWGISIAAFLALEPSQEMIAPYLVVGIYMGGAIMMLSLLGYGCWHKTFGKIAVAGSLIYVVALTTLLIQDPKLMFNGVTVSTQGNSVALVSSWAYWSYGLFFVIDTNLVWLSLFQRIKSTRQKRVRRGDLVFLVGLAITGVLALIFDVILPLFRYDLIWVGPLALSTTAISFCYALLKFRTASIDSRWLKILSSVVLTICGVIIYMLLFYLVFTALFKIPNPSTSILVLNFLMVVILLLLMPVINEVRASINSMISVGQVDMAYVLKKLNRLASRNIDLRELAGFLADHLHFDYIGFIINGRLYGSKSLSITSAELSQITHLRQTAHGVWQEPNKTVQKTFDELGLKAAAELRNAKGKTFGQLIVGKPLGKSSFERRDLIQLEMIINLVATVIDSEKHIRA